MCRRVPHPRCRKGRSSCIGPRGLFAGIFESMTVGIDGIGFENIARLQAKHWRSDAIVILGAH